MGLIIASSVTGLVIGLGVGALSIAGTRSLIESTDD